jgi:hypothetical protein
MKTELPTCGTTRPPEEPVGQVSLMDVDKASGKLRSPVSTNVIESSITRQARRLLCLRQEPIQ